MEENQPYLIGFIFLIVLPVFICGTVAAVISIVADNYMRRRESKDDKKLQN